MNRVDIAQRLVKIAKDIVGARPAHAPDVSEDLQRMIEFAKEWDSLGSAVQSQVEDLLERQYEDINPNAVDLIERRIGHLHKDIMDAVVDYANFQMDEKEKA